MTVERGEGEASIRRYEDLLACPLCGGLPLTSSFECEDREGIVSRGGLRYSRCGSCKLTFLSTRLTERAVGDLYTPDYAPYSPSASPGRPLTKSRFTGRAKLTLRTYLAPLEARLSDTYNSPPAGARLVDFGCGSPWFLDLMRARGWQHTTGVDFSDLVVTRVRSAGHDAYHADEWADAIGDDSITLIRANHVMEHLYDPRRSLRDFHKKLSSGGRLHIAVPNPRGVGARVFRRDWKSFDARHVMLYPPRLLRRVIRESGFGEVAVVHETNATDLRVSLRLRAARRARQGAPTHTSLGGERMLSSAARLAALARSADRYHVFARKD